MKTSSRIRRRSQAGFTLMEMMVVLVILSLVAGMSIGVYRQMAGQNVLPAAASRASTVIRAARNYSVSSSLPSRVYINAESDTISAFGFELVAAWSFEGLDALEIGEELRGGHEVVGAFRERAVTQGRIEVGRGKIGRGLVLLDDGASVVAPRRSRYDSTRGFSLEAWVRFWPPPLEKGEGSDRSGAWSDPRRADRYAVISRPGSYEMGLLGDGALYAVIGDADRPESSDTFLAYTASQAVLPDRWSHVRASFDGIELVLEVDGISREWSPDGFERIDPRDWPPLPERVPASDLDMMVSHPNRFFIGGIDEVKIRIAREPQVFVLPSEVSFLGASRMIRFDSRGSLDPIHHASPVLVRIGELGELLEEEEDLRGTGLVTPSLEERAEAAQEAEAQALEELLGDPVDALSRYLEERAAAADAGEKNADPELDPDRATPGEGTVDEEAAARGVLRLHRIIVDLTGTIRG